MKKGVAATTAVCFVAALAISAGCSPAANQNPTDQNEVAETVASEWSIESDCKMCHTTESSSTESQECLGSIHADQSCIECHEDESALADRHEGATLDSKMPDKLKRTEVASDHCLTCHDQKELAEKTSQSTTLTDANGTVANPHSLPSNEKHDANINCGSCHKMHSEEDVAAVAQAECSSCHHENVYECGTCHE